MSKRDQMRELFDKADKVKPIIEKDGQVYVSFEDAAVLNSINSYEGKGTGMQVRNKDGSLASTGKTVHAISPDRFFDNRYKKKNKTTMLVVSGHDNDGYRCIKEQEKGNIFIRNVPCYVFVRDAESGELRLDKVITVSDSEFISDFTNRLSNKAFAELLPMIIAFGSDLSVDDMPI